MKREPRLLFVSSSGGHYEQLKMLKPLMDKYDSKVVTEKVPSAGPANYYTVQISHTDRFVLIKLIIVFFAALRIWIKEKPDYLISTGSMVFLPFAFLAHITKKKVIFIETFAQLRDGTMTGRFIYRHNWASLFIIQWETLRDIYPNAIFGGSIY